ncbi:MAG: very short patch repair endonuclease [Blastocatellia bacterium]
MTDSVDQKTRSRTMASVPSQYTSIEQKFATLLTTAKVGRFECQAIDLPGKPDIVFRRSKVAIFVDGCFWHGCQKHLRMPASNQDYWKNKIEKNVRRDRRNRSKLREIGWKVVRVWEHDLKNSAPAINRVRKAIETQKMNKAKLKTKNHANT